jgi:hypothetical protein
MFSLEYKSIRNFVSFRRRCCLPNSLKMALNDVACQREGNSQHKLIQTRNCKEMSCFINRMNLVQLNRFMVENSSLLGSNSFPEYRKNLWFMIIHSFLKCSEFHCMNSRRLRELPFYIARVSEGLFI